MNVGFCNLILKRNMYREMKEITSKSNNNKKKLFKVKKINVTVKDKRPLLLFIELVFDSWVISFIFHF